MLSRKYSNSAELGTVRASRNPTTGHHSRERSATNDHGTRDLDLFLTVQLLEDLPTTFFFVVMSAKIMVCHGVVRRSNTKSYPKLLETTVHFLVFRAKLQATVRHERQINFSS